MTLWLVLAVMTAIALAFVLIPLSRRESAGAPRLDYDVEVYRDQLAEIDRDLELDVISAEEAEAAQNEIRRRLLEAADRPVGAVTSAGRRVVALVVAVVLPVGALITYLSVGSPDAPSLIASQQFGAAESAEAARQAERHLEELQARAEANRDDGAAWGDLGEAYMAAGRVGEAVDAYKTAVGLDRTDPTLLSAYGEALTMAADGTVTPAAKTAFQNALLMQPREPRARFFIGLSLYQSGETREALDRWVALERDSPADAPWRKMLAERIDEAASEAGIDPADLQKPPANTSGPTQEQMAAAAGMSEGDRQAMIESMVGQLAARLEKDPRDLDGWIRLSRSYEVLGRMADARDAAAKAVELAPKNAELVTLLGRLTFEAEGRPRTVSPAVADIMRRALALDADSGLALWFVGVAAAQDGDKGTAHELWTRLLAQTEPGTPQYEALKAQIDKLGAEQ
jgi:cytochrome c-type biogenesis protein CcmH